MMFKLLILQILITMSFAGEATTCDAERQAVVEGNRLSLLLETAETLRARFSEGVQNNGYSFLLANTVRYAFHSCVGGCSGCVDFNNPDNNGLQETDALFGQIYEGWEIFNEEARSCDLPILSRADLNAFAGLVAANAALGQTHGWETDLSEFEYGRVDRTICDTAFPSPHAQPWEYFQNEFDFDRRETAAIMGAHTLGRGLINNSGFTNFWVDNPQCLTVEFYDDLVNDPWTQQTVNGGQVQWVRPRRQDDNLMLNSDIQLIRNIPAGGVTINANGLVNVNNCRMNFNDCPSYDNTRSGNQDVMDFIDNDGHVFQSEFKDVYLKMLRNEGAGNQYDDLINLCSQPGIARSYTDSEFTLDCSGIESGTPYANCNQEVIASGNGDVNNNNNPPPVRPLPPQNNQPAPVVPINDDENVVNDSSSSSSDSDSSEEQEEIEEETAVDDENVESDSEENIENDSEDNEVIVLETEAPEVVFIPPPPQNNRPIPPPPQNNRPQRGPGGGRGGGGRGGRGGRGRRMM